MVNDYIARNARYKYEEVLVDLRLSEGGGFLVGSQHRRALRAALEAVEGEIRALALEEVAGLVNDPKEGLKHDRVDFARWLQDKADKERANE